MTSEYRSCTIVTLITQRRYHWMNYRMVMSIPFCQRRFRDGYRSGEFTEVGGGQALSLPHPYTLIRKWRLLTCCNLPTIQGDS